MGNRLMYKLINNKEVISPEKINKLYRTVEDKDIDLYALIDIISIIRESKTSFEYVNKEIFKNKIKEEVIVPKSFIITVSKDKFNIITIEDELEGFTVECLDLPGCISEGETEKEAIKNIKEAIEGYLECLKINNIDIKEISRQVSI